MRYHCTQIGHFAISRTRLWNNNKAQKLTFPKGEKTKARCRDCEETGNAAEIKAASPVIGNGEMNTLLLKI